MGVIFVCVFGVKGFDEKGKAVVGVFSGRKGFSVDEIGEFGLEIAEFAGVEPGRKVGRLHCGRGQLKNVVKLVK